MPREIDGDYLAMLRERRQKAAPGIATAPQAIHEEEAPSFATGEYKNPLPSVAVSLQSSTPAVVGSLRTPSKKLKGGEWAGSGPSASGLRAR